jgi:hypothetical protein
MVRIAHAMSELSGSEVEVDFEGFLSMLCELPWRKILPSENQGIMPQVPLPLPQVPQVPTPLPPTPLPPCLPSWLPHYPAGSLTPTPLPPTTLSPYPPTSLPLIAGGPLN